MASDNSALQRRALAALILAESERGGAGHGTRLPTERQLAADLGVSRAAIRHAMAVLQAEGHVSREVGRGTFLRRRGPDGPGPEPAAGKAADRAAGKAPASPAADEIPAAGRPPGRARPRASCPRRAGCQGPPTTRRPT